MTVLLSLAAAITAALAAFILLTGDIVPGGDHSCSAPCVVHFDQPMAEDEFSIDYRRGGTVEVWRSEPS